MCRSHQRIKRRHRALQCFLIILLFARADAIGQDDFYKAKAFLKAVYPELKNKNLRVTAWDDASFDSEKGMTTFTIGLEERVEDRLNNKASFKPCLGAFFSFPVAKDDRVFKLSVSGPFVNESKLDDTKKLIDAHPEWSDSRVIQALNDAGAEYGPDRKAALLERIPLHQLEPFLANSEFFQSNFNFAMKHNYRKNFQLLSCTGQFWPKHSCQVEKL